MNRVVWESKPPIDEFEKLKLAFICKGKKYYRYSDDLDIPIARKIQLDIILQELDAKVEGYLLDNWLNKMSEALDDSTKGKSVQNIAKIGFLIQEMKDRRSILLHDVIMFSIIGALYIREDQSPHVWNDEFERQKVQDLRDEYEKNGRLYDFFVKAGLNQYVPYIGSLKKDFWTLWLYQNNQRKERQKNLEAILSGDKSGSQQNGQGKA